MKAKLQGAFYSKLEQLRIYLAVLPNDSSIKCQIRKDFEMPYMTFQLEDGTEVYIEGLDVPKTSPGLIPASRGDAEGEKTIRSFETSLEGARKMAGALIKKLRQGATEQPSEVEVSFGLKASGEVGGFMVARGSLEANYAVTLKWKQPEVQGK